jgi:hypothetical protein
MLLALLPRVTNLVERPLGDEEAVNALNALKLTSQPAPEWPGDDPNLSASPMYEWMTGFIFQYAGSGEVQARIIPAIAGTLLALIPILFLNRVSRLELLLSSAFLAVSPVAISLSRSADSRILSALFLAAALMLVFTPDDEHGSDRKWIWIAIFLGASLASGSGIYHGLFSILIAFLLIRWIQPDVIHSERIVKAWSSFLRQIWITPLVAVLLATGVGTYRFGAAGLGEALVLWLRGWIPFGQLSAIGYLIAGIVYEPFILIVGLIGAIAVWRSGYQFGKTLALWALGSVIAILIYPGRAAQDWIWTVIPLALLSGQVVCALFERLAKREEWLQVVALVSIAIALISAAIITLMGYLNGYLQQMLMGDETLIIVALMAMLFLLISVFVLFGLGWSWDIVIDGAGIVVILIAMMASISAAWKLENDQGLGFRTLWVSSAPTENGKYFQSTLENASLALTGNSKAAPVLIQGEVEPSILWRLRSYPRFELSGAQGNTSPPVLVAPEGVGLGPIGAEYLGQSFALTQERGWFGLVPPDLLRWSLTNSSPTASRGWVLYIRADVLAHTDFSTE